jgi:hypothetical protein
LVHRASADAPPLPSAGFDGRLVAPDDDFDPSAQTLFDGEPVPAPLPPRPAYYAVGAGIDLSDLPGNGLINELWERARDEVIELGLAFR